MAVTFRILPDRFLVYIRYRGRMTIADNRRVLDGIANHPDYRKGMRGLVDLRDLTEWDRDFAGIMRLHAAEAEVHDPSRPTLLVCLAPSAFAKRVARFINRTWDGSDRKVTVTVETVPEALAVLGIDAPSISALLPTA